LTNLRVARGLSIERRYLFVLDGSKALLAAVEKVFGNNKRWQGGDHRARWTAAGLLEAEKKFRKVKGYRKL